MSDHNPREQVNERRRAKRKIRRELWTPIWKMGRGGVLYLAHRRPGLSGRQWVRLRKQLNKQAKRQEAMTYANPLVMPPVVD